MAQSTPHPISLAFYKFHHAITYESRVYWSVAAAQRYAVRWWETIPEEDRPLSLVRYPGDNIDPIRRVTATPKDYIAELPRILSSVLENAIVSCVTVFETYLREIMQRSIYLKPTLLEDSDIALKAKDISTVSPAHFREWFADKIADHYIRGKTHKQMISRLNGLLLLGISKGHKAVDEWGRWELLRNAIAHNWRKVSSDLSANWPERFPTTGSELQLLYTDLATVSALARTLASSMDLRFRSGIVGNADDELLARELFVRFGKDDPIEVAKSIFGYTRGRLQPNRIKQIISEQRAENTPVQGYDFTSFFGVKLTT